MRARARRRCGLACKRRRPPKTATRGAGAAIAGALARVRPRLLRARALALTMQLLIGARRLGVRWQATARQKKHFSGVLLDVRASARARKTSQSRNEL